VPLNGNGKGIATEVCADLDGVGLDRSSTWIEALRAT
jgi:hypothetical protein